MFILIGKLSFAFLPPHTFVWDWIHSTQMWRLIDGGLYFSGHEVTLCPSDPLHKLKQLLEPRRLGDGGEKVHSPPILESSSCKKLCICKHVLSPLGASKEDTFLWPYAGEQHNEFDSSSWQTEVQDELYLNELLLALPWWCPHVWYLHMCLQALTYVMQIAILISAGFFT